MNLLYKVILLLIFINLQSCSKDEKQISSIKGIDQESEMALTYKDAMDSLNKGDYYYASKKFLEAELLYPQSRWAPKSVIMASYSYYLQDYYSEAIYNLERFIKTYPDDDRKPYAHYLLAMCYYELIEDEKKDIEPLLKAIKSFELVIANYPNSDFAVDAQFKLNLINEIMASKEMYLGRHYLKKEKWIPAINRFQSILENYNDSIYVEEATHRLVEIHYKIGLENEAKKYAKLLGYNYQSSSWYKKSYKLFNKNYKSQVLKNKKENKKIGSKIRKRLKGLFE
tara:strand:- start:973 stop:1821 length:849 start_codon:yes stop_codon:yes gene_type:complete